MIPEVSRSIVEVFGMAAGFAQFWMAIAVTLQ
jgi:hypothetical protein